MKEINRSDVVIDSRCGYCKVPVAWVDAKTGDYYASEHINILGVIVCPGCYGLAGIVLQFRPDWRERTVPYSVN